MKDIKSFLEIINFHKILYEEIGSFGCDEKIKNYYQNILRFPQNYWFYAFNWARRIEQPIKILRNEMNLLDAGCGLGTESIYFANLGIKVIGIDLKQEFIEGARKRKNYYENKFNKLLNIDFKTANIFNLNEENYFDIIWAMESVSHIYPPEAFFEKAYSMLKPGGLLFISDTNSLNPIIQINMIRLTGKVFRETVKRRNPATGEVVEEGSENLLNPIRLISTLKQDGYKNTKIEYSMFLPHRFFKKEGRIIRGYNMEKIINRIWPLKHFGGVYNIIAQR